MYGNPLTRDAIVDIMHGLKSNYTLEMLLLPLCPEGIKKRINSLQEIIIKKRKTQEV